MPTREQRNSYSQQYYAKNKPKIAARVKRYRVENPDLVRAWGRKAVRRQRLKVRNAVLRAYGATCACCGDRHTEFLALDHVNGDGAEHRRQLGGNRRSPRSHQVYVDVIRRGFPPEFRLLCHNCNMARSIYGACPHESERLEAEKGVPNGRTSRAR